jgi:malate dehydrogenase (oxaloacetate-decarboxylating)
MAQNEPPDGKSIETGLRSYALLNNPRLNKGTAFTEQERTIFSLHGLLPPHEGTLDDQTARRLKVLRNYEAPFAKYAFMRDLQDTNETLFYALITRNVEEILPIVYTPTVGEGCQRFSEIWRKPRGVFLSYPNKHRIRQILSDSHYDQVRCIVVSDGERILGLGDQGAGGMGIPIGKMALYTALGGIPPEFCLPILLDVGTDNEDRLNDPLYIGWRNKRIRGPEYDEFVEEFVSAVKERWPHVLLQWEDFAGSNALRLLERYRNQLCTFNDDIQGTAAVATGTLLSAVNVTGIPIKDHRIAIVGMGSAGLGIANLLVSVMQADGLSEQDARARFYAVDQHGLLIDGVPGIRAEQQGFVRQRSDVQGWELSGRDEISLLEVVRNAKPTVLIGVSGQAGVFTQEVIRQMARNAERPIIFPLSNPTSRSEATAQDVLDWTEGRALVGTGSPFDPVKVNGKLVKINQTNNSYTFPGLALGIISARAKFVSDLMIRAAATALAELSPTRRDKQADLLPPLGDSRAISLAIARAVGKQAITEGLSGLDESGFEKELDANVWNPVYLPYKLINADGNAL